MLRYALALLAVVFAAPAFAAAPDAATLAAFADEEAPRLMRQHHVAGMVVAFVKDGQIAFTKGYGFRDVEHRLPVDPDKTLFRAGSISKLFIWTSVMQLVEQGLIDLDTDVNRYLKDFQVPATYPQPITMRHLMGHTPGFEDQLVGLFEDNPVHPRTLAQAMQHPPRRVAPPGQLLSYSNYGAALAGYIVEQVSGIPFDQYVEQKILKPLGMNRATFVQPVPANLAADVSVGYTARGEKFTAQPFEFVSGLYPAGSLSVTANDAARFLLAHLNRGSLDGNQILAPETVDRMRTISSSVAPGFSGMAHGFLRMDTGGGPALYHGGDTLFFHSLTAILPDQQFGFFVSTNTATGGLAAAEFTTDVLNKFFASTPGEVKARDFASPAPASRFVGRYLVDRHSESDLSRVAMLAMAVGVEPAPEGGVLISSFIRPKPERYVQVGRNQFQQASGGEQVMFLEDDTGAVRSLVLGLLPVMSFSRPGLADSPLLTVIVLLLAILLLLTGLIAPPTGLLALLKRYRASGEARTAARVGLLLIASYIAFFVVMGVSLTSGPFALFADTPGKRVMTFIPYAGLLFGLVAVWYAVRAWRHGHWGVLRRAHYSALVVSTLALFWLLAHWKGVA